MEQTPGAGVVTVNEPREDDSREIALRHLMEHHRLTRPRRSKDSPPRSSTPARNCSTGIRGKTIS
mgnify:CR=1 FL=1